MESHTIKSRIKSLLGSPSIKLRKNRCRIKENLSSKVTLERVLGITSSGNSALTCDPCSGTVAYPAGCVVVLLNPAKNRQQHLINASRKTITTLSFSSDGKYLVTGENGHLPAVRVWDVAEGTQVAELQEHKYEVACVAFSPNSKYIVSVGSQHDMSVNVWAWKKNTLVAANKVSSKVTAVSFSEDSSHFVTAGNRHVRFWYLEPSQSNKLSAPVPLMGRSGLLGELQNNFFCDVACGRGQKSDSTFCITSSGLLCEFNEKRMLDKWVDLQTSAARSLSVTEDLIFCACANGTVRVFSPSDLHFICTLPRPHHLGIDVTTISQASHLFSRKPEARYPDSVAVTYDPVNHWLSCVYNDHSLYVWDTRELERVGKVHSALYHSGSVWDLQMCPKDADGSKVGAGSSGLFYSCSGDGTVRMWSTEGISSGNVLSNDLQKVIYIDDHTSSLLDVEGTAISSTDKPEGQTSESKTGIRTICVSPDGRHLASGDRTGTLRVHDLTSMKEILKAEAHDSEILCLEYSKPETGMNLLATASRDRLIHVLDVEEDYGLLQTLDEHSSSITAVHFAANEGKVRIISCGADKSIYFRTAHRTLRGTEFKRSHHVVRKTTPYDMDVDPNCKYAAVSCQDRSIRVFNISSGKLKRSFKGSQTEDGGLLKIQIDPSGLYVATSCSDKNISLFDFQTGECLAAMFGHSEVITSLKFTSDCRHLISASGDSCIFVWRLAPELTVNMRERLSQLRRRQSGQSVKNSPFRRTSTNSFTLHHSPSILTYSSESEREEEEDEEEEEDVKRSEEKDCHQETNHQLSLSEFSIEEEPGASDEGNEWNPVKDPSAESSLSEVPPRPRRRWSCRIGSLELMVKSMLELRQLDSLSKAGPHNRGPVGKLRVEERGSTASLQECKNKRRPHSAWLAPATTPEPEGVVLYPEHCLSTTSLPGPAYMIQSPAEGIEEAEQEGKTEEAECHDCLSPISGFSMGYGSGGSSPEQDHDDSDDPEPLSSDVPSERGEEVDMDRSEISSPESSEQEDTLADNSGTGNQIRPKGTSSRLHGQKSTSRSGSVFLHKTGKKSGPSATVKPTVTMVKPLIDGEVSGNGPVDKGEMNPSWRGPALRSTSQRNHPYLGRTASPISKPLSGLQKSNSIQNLAADTRKSLTPSRLKREACPSLPKLIMEKNDSRTNARHPSSTAPSSPQPWESPNFSRIPRARSYMSPTTSSIAKITRSVSIGDGLHLGTSSNEASFSTPPSSPSRLSCPILSSPSTPGDPKHAGPKTLPSRAVKPRVSQRMSSPFAEFPSRATPTTHNDSFHKNSFEFKALHVDPSSDPEPDENIKLSPSTITSYPKAVEDHLQPESFSQALQSERPQVAVKAFTVTSDAPGDQGLPRRRSSSIFLTSVPLCLPLHHCSPGIVPLCFTPFFSLSSFSSFSSHHRVSERSVNLDSCRQAAAELCSSVRKTTQLYRTLMSSDGEGCPEQQQMRQVLSEALFCVRSELDCVPRPGPAMMGEEGLNTLALLEQYSKLLLQSVENRLQHNL